MNELDLIDLDALLFLQRLFDRQYLVLGFKIERLLASRKSLDENLSTVVAVQQFPKRHAQRRKRGSKHSNKLNTKI
jgi:hypothetical protein